MATLLNEVDMHDRPTGRQVTKQEAHDNKLLHRCVAIYVFDEQGRLYVQVHKKSGGLLDNSVGGHVDAGEDYPTAAKREGEEELGLYGVELHELATSMYSDEGRYLHMFGLYECRPKDWKFVPNDEVEQIIPMTLEEVVEQMNADPMRFCAGFIQTMHTYIRLKKLPFTLTAHKPKSWQL
jgi:isopentenyldiphosphate isomerase